MGIEFRYFYKNTCMQCALMNPLVDKLEKDYPEAKVQKFNSTKENKNQFDEDVVDLVPTILLVKDGRVQTRHIGYVKWEVLQKSIKSYLLS